MYQKLGQGPPGLRAVVLGNLRRGAGTGEDRQHRPPGVPGLDAEREGVKAQHRHRRMKALKSWLSWCVNEGLAPRIPDFPKGIPEARQVPQALKRAKVNRLLQEVEREGDPRDAGLIIRLMLSCGLRVSEGRVAKVGGRRYRREARGNCGPERQGRQVQGGARAA